MSLQVHFRELAGAERPMSIQMNLDVTLGIRVYTQYLPSGRRYKLPTLGNLDPQG